jgi:dolichyl-phosphate beta-glucosyltransferase
MSYSAYQIWKTTPIRHRPYLSVVIPAYNEAERIIPTIGAIAAHISSFAYDWELIIADDGSRDGTADLVTDLQLVNLRLLRAERNSGKGNAVRRGMLAARGERILFTDADNSTPIEELNKLMAALDKGYDLAIGSRAALGAQETNRSILRSVTSTTLRWLVRVLFRIGVQDTQCGFKLFTAASAQRLCQIQTINGFSFDLELIYLANKLGYRIAEIPIDWIDAPGSKVQIARETRRFLADLLHIMVNDLRGRYNTATH